MAPDPRPTRVEHKLTPPGSLWIGYQGVGTTDGKNDSPSKLVTLSMPYYLDEREVAVADYRACVMEKVCPEPDKGTYGGQVCTYGVNGQDSHPVTCVTKPQAEAFCTWMGRRLPTEEEWEFAALGSTGTGGQRFVFPGLVEAQVSSKACWRPAGTCPTGTYEKTYMGRVVSASEPGFYDLLGNAWEKTSSPYCLYSVMNCTSGSHVLRGGSAFDTDLGFARATSRIEEQPTKFYPNQGFRCARNSTP